MDSKPRVVVLGGGTGTFTVLSGLKRHDIDLTAIVSVADNGGSTGILRDELGVLPPGDIRQCLVALAAQDDIVRDLFTYRFHEGSLSGHNFGNLFLSALEKLTGDPLSAVREAHRILNVKGRVIPVSARASNLFAELEDGSTVEGEHAIDDESGDRSPIQRCFLSPSVPANPDAINAIRSADLIVLGPGDLFTSLVPVLLVDSIAQEIALSKAKKVFVVNLVTKCGQTDNYTANSFVKQIFSYLSSSSINAVVLNSAEPSTDVLEKYRLKNELPVVDDLVDADVSFQIIRAPLLATGTVKSTAGDTLRRSFLRHDPDLLASAILSLR